MPPNVSMAVSLKANQPTIVYQASHAGEAIVTVEVQNNSNVELKIPFHVVHRHDYHSHEDVDFILTVGVGSKAKRQNIEVPAGHFLVCYSKTSLGTAKVYQAALYTRPGEIEVSDLEPSGVDVFLNENTALKTVRAIYPANVISVTPTSARINNTQPANFSITRVGPGDAEIQFVIDELRLATKVIAKEVLERVGEWSDDKMALFYKNARDCVEGE